MASNLKLAVAIANAMLDALGGAPANGGKLCIYDGTQPATPETAITTQNKLAELSMNADAFPGAASNQLTANAITQDVAADRSGTATWFRLWRSDGTTPILDGSVGTADCDLNLDSVNIIEGGTVSVVSFTITQPVA